MNLQDVRDKWLNQCGSCDAGLPMSCTCPAGDPRTVILELVMELEKLQTNFELLSCSTMGEALDELELLLETRKKLREVYLAARDASYTSAAAHHILLLIPPRLLIYK